MAKYLLSYDLIKTKNYQKVWDAIEEVGGHRITESLWVVDVNNTLAEVFDWLKSLVDDDDRTFVTVLDSKKTCYNNAIKGTKKWFQDNP